MQYKNLLVYYNNLIVDCDSESDEEFDEYQDKCPLCLYRCSENGETEQYFPVAEGTMGSDPVKCDIYIPELEAIHSKIVWDV